MNQFTCNVEEATFDERVIAHSHTTPVVLDIGADWCSPCRVLKPLLEKLALQYNGQFLLAKVDADENMRIAGRHQVKGFSNRNRLQPRANHRPFPRRADRALCTRISGPPYYPAHCMNLPSIRKFAKVPICGSAASYVVMVQFAGIPAVGRESTSTQLFHSRHWF
ncbi:thioredoxin family protein [Candidatus Aalborgicola defluviihabitans]|uniref:thioredoxin family protein n=1 Tax=Candidatus Aalborgicola defluviihabitans TaxID=3386187 RepID=UPI0039B8CEA0